MGYSQGVYREETRWALFKFLFLPKMGLLGSQAVLEKKVQFWIMSNFLALFFQIFMDKIFFLNFFLHCSVRTKKLLNKKVKKIEKKNFAHEKLKKRS